MRGASACLFGHNTQRDVRAGATYLKARAAVAMHKSCTSHVQVMYKPSTSHVHHVQYMLVLGGTDGCTDGGVSRDEGGDEISSGRWWDGRQ